MAKTNDQFILEAKDVHGDTYSYEMCQYKNSKTKVAIICEEHGVFSIRPSNHLDGRGCKKCGVVKCSSQKRLPFSEVLKRFKEVHGDTYSYIEGSFSGTVNKMTAICKQHGEFYPTPSNHISGKGCTKCAQEASRSNTKDFVEKANVVHDSKYDYSLVEYTTTLVKVKIICKDHGEFSQAPFSHLQGYGCPKCPGSGFRRDKKGYLYILEDEDLVKVGITNRQVHARLSEINAKGKEFKVVTTFVFQDGNDAFLLESKLLKHLRNNFSNPAEKFDGYTECFINVRVEEVISLVRSLI